MKKLFVIVSTVFISNVANANIIDFSGNICNGNAGACSDGREINQSYADIAGQLDVVYDRNIGQADAGTDASRLQFWDDYSNLNGVAWGDSGSASEIFLKPLDGSLVTLNSVDFGSYLDFDRTSQFTVLDGSTNASLFSSGTFSVSALAVSFTDLNLSSLNGLRLQWGPDAFNVGIDNIDYTLGGGTPSEVPIPAAAWLFGSGIMGLFGMRRSALV